MRTRLVTALLAVITAILVVPAQAVADEQSGGVLTGEIRQPGTASVEDIDITVFDGEDEIGTATTDSDGFWEVEVPEPGTYRIVLDEDSVPDEYIVRDPPGAEQERAVAEGGEETVAFRVVLPEDLEEETEPDEASEATEPDGVDDTDLAETDEADDPSVEVPGVERGAPFVDRLAQTMAAGLLFGLVIAISSIGLSLIFGTTRMINFAHGDMVTFGAMMAMLFSTGAAGLGNALLGILLSVAAAVGVGTLVRGRMSHRGALAVQWAVLLVGVVASVALSTALEETLGWRVSLVWAAVIAVVLGGALGAGLERFIWRPLRRRNVALIQMFIVSIGLALVLRNVIQVMFGPNRERYRQYRIQELMEFGPVSMAPRDVSIMVVSVVVLVAVACLLQFTRIGKAMRAVSDNRDLAESSGIDVDRVTLYVWTLGGALAALGGVAFGLNQTVHYEMGFMLLLLMFAGVILGGLGTAYGAMVGGIFIGLIAMLSTLWFPTQLMEAWALVCMIVMLLVRPQGILGQRERVG